MLALKHPARHLLTRYNCDHKTCRQRLDLGPDDTFGKTQPLLMGKIYVQRVSWEAVDWMINQLYKYVLATFTSSF